MASGSPDSVLKNLHKVERRQWWLWGSAVTVTLLLTGGLLSFTFPIFFEKVDGIYIFNLQESMRGLLYLVLLFDIYLFYQQLQIYRVRRQLLESQKLFLLIGENAEDLIAVVDAQGRRLYNSPSYEKVLGYSAEELKATSNLEQIHPDDRIKVMEAAQEASRTGRGHLVEYRFRHKDGTWRVLESTASAVRNAKGETAELVIVNRDITARKKAEEVLRLKDEQLKQSQKMEAVGRLSGGIAHDFNNLLGVILGYSDVLELRLAERDPLRKHASEIKKAGQRAASLTRQLLAFSRQQVLQPKILDLNGVVADIGKMLQRMIGEDIELVTSLDPQLGKVKADQSQIEQVIMNLAVNARDAMPEGGKLLIQTSNVELGEEVVASQPYVRPGHYVLLAVTDSGMGMDSGTMAHIFEPFFTTKEKGKGTGLGLATVYGVVKQSEGYIWVDSEPGKGASFKIYLPIVAKAVEELLLENRQDNSPQGTETILLVEDEESLRALVTDLLSEAGYKVLTANCGSKALEIAEKFAGTIHLLLTDVVMPGIGGPALAKKLGASRPDMKIMFMSGYIEFHSGENGGLPPGTQLLQKPFSNEVLIREISKVLESTAVQGVR